MANIVPIPAISAQHINMMIETRGKVIRADKTHMLIQECQKNNDQGAHIPFNINAHYVEEFQVLPGYFVKIIGVPQLLTNKGTNVSAISIECSQVTIISEDEADMSSIFSTATFFTEKALEDIKMISSQELIDCLQQHANEEGFKLVQTHSKNDIKFKLRCYLHSTKNKNPFLNTDCPFYINIRQSQSKTDHRWKVATSCLVHNHNRDPFLFIHKLIGPDIEKLILNMMKNGVSSPIIAKIIHDNYGTTLSSTQINDICKAHKNIKKQQRLAETEELKEYMQSTDGIFYYDDKKDDHNVIRRKVVATFTKEEYSNLSTYGDFVSIDPTFTRMSSNWSIIPLTIVGAEREIRSAGIIFASSTKSKIFRWILNLLVDILPCKDKLKTICSDDDNGLAGAFTEVKATEEKTETDDKILNLHRVICFWHKIQNFNSYVNSLKLPENESTKIKNLFKLMGMTRDENFAKQCYDELIQNDHIKEYMNENIDEKIDIMIKSKIQYFTCGYNTSSISESSNNRLKSCLPKRPLSLKEIREEMSFVEHNSYYSKRYIKGRKMKKVRSPDIVEIMSHFHVSQSIAEAISGSINKTEDLEINIIRAGLASVTEKKINYITGEKYEENFIISDGRCSCNKQESAGLPCSHYIKYLMETKQNVYDNITINQRWIITIPQAYEYIPNIVNKITSDTAVVVPLDEKERFILLRSRSIALVNLASKSHETYELFEDLLKDAEQKLSDATAPPMIIDEFGIKPGRKKGSGSEVFICTICGESHRTERCPYRQELMNFVPPGSTKEGKRHCSICLFAGHNSATCPAKKAWLEFRKSLEQE